MSSLLYLGSKSFIAFSASITVLAKYVVSGFFDTVMDAKI
jgi:hypothetical protein